MSSKKKIYVAVGVGLTLGVITYLILRSIAKSKIQAAKEQTLSGNVTLTIPKIY